MTPAAVQTRDSVITFNGLLAPRALPRTVAFDPMVEHRLRRPLALHVRRYAGCRRSLNASLVDCILAD